MHVDCHLRTSTGIRVDVNGVNSIVRCGRYYNTGGDSMKHVGDLSGPSCVYFLDGRLIGCAGKGKSTWIKGYPGAVVKVVLQPSKT
jgi:hypothetical protein